MNKKYFFGGALVILTVYLSFNTIAKIAFETISGHVLGTKVTTSEVHANIVTGHFQAKDLKIFNPEKFKEPYLFEAVKIDLTLHLKSLFTNTIRIDDIEITSGNIIYEIDPKLSIQDNIDIIKKNIQNYTNNDEPEKKVIIRSFIISNCKFKYNLDESKTHTITLSNVYIKNIGVKETGVYLKQAGWQILIELLLKG